MPPGSLREDELRERNRRLSVELEQAHGAAEAAEKTLRTLARERDTAAAKLTQEASLRRQAEALLEQILATVDFRANRTPGRLTRSRDATCATNLGVPTTLPRSSARPRWTWQTRRWRG